MNVDSLTSFAFVVAGVAVAIRAWRDGDGRFTFALLLVATGVGSFVQHGPDPAWADLAHDLPLVALIAFLMVESGSQLRGRRFGPVWWIVPTGALVPVIVGAPSAGDAAQGGLGVAAVAVFLQLVRVRPGTRARALPAMALLALGGSLGTLSRPGMPLAEGMVGSVGHAVWHVLAAIALWWLAPIVDRRTGDASSDPPGGALVQTVWRSGARRRDARGRDRPVRRARGPGGPGGR